MVKNAFNNLNSTQAKWNSVSMAVGVKRTPLAQHYLSVKCSEEAQSSEGEPRSAKISWNDAPLGLPKSQQRPRVHKTCINATLEIPSGASRPRRAYSSLHVNAYLPPLPFPPAPRHRSSAFRGTDAMYMQIPGRAR